MVLSSTASAIRKRKWREDFSERYLHSNRNNTWKALGIDVDKANELWYNVTQCQICGQNTGPFHIDHNHKTNKIRGKLCRDCNLGLGNFKDNPKSLLKATKYLIEEDKKETSQENSE